VLHVFFIASKYEEISPPSIDQFVYVTAGAYTKNQILHTELLILNNLKFRLTSTTVINFLPYYLAISNTYEKRIEHLANYLAEITLLFSAFLLYRPSQIAAAIVCLSNYSLGYPAWSPLLEMYTQYSLDSLCPCIQLLISYHRRISTTSATEKPHPLCRKYRQSIYGRVTQIHIPQKIFL